MIANHIYNIEVAASTRNHKGSFVQDAPYKLIRVDEFGWALICLDDATCHYVDPDNLRQPVELADRF